MSLCEVSFLQHFLKFMEECRDDLGENMQQSLIKHDEAQENRKAQERNSILPS